MAREKQFSLSDKAFTWLNSKRAFYIFGLLVLLSVGIVVGIVAWNCSRCWIPFGQDFTCIDGVLTVRGAYFGFGFLVELLALGAGLFIFAKVFILQRFFKPSLVAISVALFVLLLLIVVNIVTARSIPSLIRDEQKIEVREFSCWDLPEAPATCVRFDRRCLRFVAPYDFEFPSLPQDLSKEKNGIYASLGHGHECCCSSKKKKQFISAEYFPFDASVLLYAIAQGKVDLQHSGDTRRLWLSVIQEDVLTPSPIKASRNPAVVRAMAHRF